MRDEHLVRIGVTHDDMLLCFMGNVYLEAQNNRGWMVDEQIETRYTLMLNACAQLSRRPTPMPISVTAISANQP